MSFALTGSPIETTPLLNSLQNSSSGGMVIFEGRVRDSHKGREVRSLEYEAFDALCLNEGEDIVQEARARFGLLNAACVHRTGHLEVGAMAIWIGVAAAHRDEAFQGCRYIIEEVKRRLPVWKKEYYVEGESTWINCSDDEQANRLAMLSPAKLYERQVRLASVGKKGQERLNAAKVLVVGAGGLGAPVLTYLATAGIGTIVVADADDVEASNLHRQVLFGAADLGKKKAIVAAERIRALNPFISVETCPERITVQNAGVHLEAVDIVVDCTDNFSTKFLLNDMAFVKKKILVQGAVYQFEGQVQVFGPHTASCLRCQWPSQPPNGCVGACADVGVLGSVVGVVGSIQATEVIKAVLDLPGRLHDETLMVDLLSLETTRIARTRNRHCPLCGETPKIRSPHASMYSEAGEDFVLSFERCTQEELGSFEFIDIRNPDERNETSEVERNVRSIPMPEFWQRLGELKSDHNYVLICAAGVRSRALAQNLRERGYMNFYSLREGMSEFVRLKT